MKALARFTVGLLWVSVIASIYAATWGPSAGMGRWITTAFVQAVIATVATLALAWHEGWES